MNQYHLFDYQSYVMYLSWLNGTMNQYYLSDSEKDTRILNWLNWTKGLRQLFYFGAYTPFVD